MKHSQLSYSSNGSPHQYCRSQEHQISWLLRQPRLIAKEIASTFRSYVARPLHLAANDKKGTSLLHRLFLG